MRVDNHTIFQSYGETSMAGKRYDSTIPAAFVLATNSVKNEEVQQCSFLYQRSQWQQMGAFWRPLGSAKVPIAAESKPTWVATPAGGQYWIAVASSEACVKWDADNRTWRLFDPDNTVKPGCPVKFKNGVWQLHSEVGLRAGGGALTRFLDSSRARIDESAINRFNKEIPPEIYMYKPQSKLAPSQTYTVHEAEWALRQARDISHRENFCAVFDQHFRIETQDLSFNVKEFLQNLYRDSETFRRFFNYAADYDFHHHFARAFREIGTRRMPVADMSASAGKSWDIKLSKNGRSSMDVPTHTVHLCSAFSGGIPDFYIGSEGHLVRASIERKAIHEFLHVLTGITHDLFLPKDRNHELIGLGERGAIVYLEDRIIAEARLNMPKRVVYRVFRVIGAPSNLEKIELDDLPPPGKQVLLSSALKNIPVEALINRAITLMNLQDAYLDNLFPRLASEPISTTMETFPNTEATAPADASSDSVQNSGQPEDISSVGPSDFLETISGLH